MKTAFNIEYFKKFTAALLVTLMIMMVAVPVQKAAATVVAELPDYPANSFEARLDKYEFDSYDEIIGLLEGDEAYALVKVLGLDENVLLVAETTFEPETGMIYAVEATPYTMKSNGKVTADSLLYGGGTATPLAIDSQGVICCATHTSMEKQCYGENGSPNKALMLLSYVYVDEFDKDGNPATVGGFLRTTNNLLNDDLTDIESSNVAFFEQMFKDYEAAEPILFTSASANIAELPDYPANSFEERLNRYSFSSYEEIISLLQGDEVYAFVKVLGQDENVLMIAETTFEPETGMIYAVEATPYTMKSNGKVTADSQLCGGGTATPLAVDKQGVIYCANHTTMEKLCYGENGTANKGIMVLGYVYILEFDENGSPASVSGFTRTVNDLVNDDTVYIESSNTAVFEQMFKDYAAAEPILFQKALSPMPTF